MAEKNITTWEEFKDALNETPTENTTYIIKNDIDATGDILTTGFELPESNFTKTFVSDNKKVNGITSYNNITVFSGNSVKTTFKNIHFSNFMLQTGKFASFYNSRRSLYTFDGCYFNGLCSTIINMSSHTTAGDRIRNCSFNVKCNSIGFFCIFESCYFVIDSFAKTNGFGRFEASDCYFSGSFRNTLSNGDNFTSLGGEVGLSLRSSCVFNAKIIITNYSASRNYYAPSSNGETYASLANSDFMLQSDGTTKIPTTQLKTEYEYTKWLTDAQMKDKTYIQQNTQFPLYG